ncbi:HET-domain-containing protein [Cubamyces sp. BRFM 1775]|nr:HET-domain-containing protein [Cubamyces sp. BRFM 1775]
MLAYTARSRLSHRACITTESSAGTLSKAKRLIHECWSNHSICTKFALHPLRSAPLPTRLIDCSNPSRPRIVQMGPDAKGVYVTLSYVWGGPQSHRTCRANLASYIDGINPIGLPQTIRDAIYVTHVLGFRLLWIDSLCIVQDWPEDLQRELGRMRYIYRHAFLTIDAAGAASVNDGFLHDKAFLTQCGVQLSHPRLGTQSRAWCLQETLMSCRSLVFTTSTVQFWCRTGSQNVDDVYSLDHTDLMLQDRPSLPDIVLKPTLQSRGHPIKRLDVYYAWRRMLTYYTDRILSHSADKLVACAGLAEDFGRILGSEYLAGLWRKSLLYDLLWRVSYISPGHINPCRPSPYRAPSWSWASVDGCVSWDQSHLSGFVTTEPLADVIECSVTLQDKKLPFGRVTDGSLFLRASLLPCEFLRPIARCCREGWTQNGQQRKIGYGVAL